MHWEMMRQARSVSRYNRRKTWEAERGKQLGLWETGPRETLVAPLESITLAQLGF